MRAIVSPDVTVEQDGTIVGSSALLNFVGATVSFDPATRALDIDFAPETFIWNQSVPEATWDIVHNLGRFPSVAVVDSGGNEVEADVRYVSDDELVISFVSANGGFAYLN